MTVSIHYQNRCMQTLISCRQRIRPAYDAEVAGYLEAYDGIRQSSAAQRTSLRVQCSKMVMKGRIEAWDGTLAPILLSIARSGDTTYKFKHLSKLSYRTLLFTTLCVATCCCVYHCYHISCSFSRLVMFLLSCGTKHSRSNWTYQAQSSRIMPASCRDQQAATSRYSRAQKSFHDFPAVPAGSDRVLDAMFEEQYRLASKSIRKRLGII